MKYPYSSFAHPAPSPVLPTTRHPQPGGVRESAITQAADQRGRSMCAWRRSPLRHALRSTPPRYGDNVDDLLGMVERHRQAERSVELGFRGALALRQGTAHVA